MNTVPTSDGKLNRIVTLYINLTTIQELCIKMEEVDAEIKEDVVVLDIDGTKMSFTFNEFRNKLKT